jgi:protein O-mannosyl-transferase
VTKASPNKTLIICLLISVTAAVYWHVYGFSFISSYDDGAYVTQNAHVQAGLTWSNLVWALTARVAANWHPVTLLSHMMDCQLFGLAPAGPHLTNLAIHIINVVLLFWVLQLATARVWRSAFVAALFAIHPLNVESVAWIAERKNVLSTMFFLLAIWAYVRYARAPNWKRYLAVATLFALGLMSKPMLVTFPFLLLLLDFWPLGRWNRRAPSSLAYDRLYDANELDPGPGPVDPKRRRSARYLVLEKAPLALLSVASCLLTLRAQWFDSAVAPQAVIPAGSRISNALVSYIIYLENTVWPSGLAAFYPHPVDTLTRLQVGLAAAGLLATTCLAVRLASHFEFFTFGWFWYLSTLIPVIGLVQVGAQSRADRYAYIPLIGVFIIVVWGVSEAAAHWSLAPGLPAMAAVCAIIALALITTRQVTYWHDSISLFRHAEKVTNDNYIAYGVLYRDYAAAGNFDQALPEYSKALNMEPRNEQLQVGYARALQRGGRLDQAITHFRVAFDLDPESYDRCNELGVSLAEAGDLDEAANCFDRVLLIKPDDAHAYANLGKISEQKGDIPTALSYYRRSIAAMPNDPLLVKGNTAREMAAQVSLRIGALLAASGRPDVIKAP